LTDYFHYFWLAHAGTIICDMCRHKSLEGIELKLQ